MEFKSGEVSGRQATALERSGCWAALGASSQGPGRRCRRNRSRDWLGNKIGCLVDLPCPFRSSQRSCHRHSGVCPALQRRSDGDSIRDSTGPGLNSDGTITAFRAARLVAINYSIVANYSPPRAHSEAPSAGYGPRINFPLPKAVRPFHLLAGMAAREFLIRASSDGKTRTKNC